MGALAVGRSGHWLVTCSVAASWWNWTQLQVIQSATDWPQYQSVELFLVIDLQLEASPKGVCHGREC